MPEAVSLNQRYQDQLQNKVERLRSLFAAFNIPEIEVFPSKPTQYRMRAEFRIWHNEDRCFYAMFKPGNKNEPYEVSTFPAGSPTIQTLMPQLLAEINDSEALRRKLFQVEFLTSQTGESCITLIYHRQLEQQWQEEAKRLNQKLNSHIIGRARKQKLCIDSDYIEETLTVNGQHYYYQQVENSFTQPNAFICEKMLEWAQASASFCSGDLVELYCGNGNFTVALAHLFPKVLATEISKVSVKSALHNLESNQINNVVIARMSSEEFTQAMNRERAFRRLKDISLDDYSLDTIFVDPPRAGLDAETEKLVQRFKHIIYVSCNPATLQHNLTTLAQTHEIQRVALFDQFPFTDHIETGVLLTKKTG